MEGSVVFARLRRCASPCNSSFLWPTRVHSPNGIWICSAIVAQLTGECLRAARNVISPKNTVPSHGGSALPSNTCFLGLHKSIAQTASRSVSRLCAAHGRQSLYFTMGPFPQNCPFPWWIWTSFITHCSLGPPESTTQTASQSFQPFLQGSLL